MSCIHECHNHATPWATLSHLSLYVTDHVSFMAHPPKKQKTILLKGLDMIRGSPWISHSDLHRTPLCITLQWTSAEFPDQRVQRYVFRRAMFPTWETSGDPGMHGWVMNFAYALRICFLIREKVHISKQYAMNICDMLFWDHVIDPRWDLYHYLILIYSNTCCSFSGVFQEHDPSHYSSKIRMSLFIYTMSQSNSISIDIDIDMDIDKHIYIYIFW